jgi:hypothetical protein
MSLPESLERAATELTSLSNQIRPANGDPHRLLEELEPAQAGDVLVWMLVHAPDSAEELVDAWGEWEKGAEVLLTVADQEVADQGGSKSARKVLRKAHHRLRSRGIEVASGEKPAVRKRRVAAVDDPFEAASLSSPDFRGARIGYLADRHPAGGARLFEIRFDEGRGILDFKVYNAGRSKVRGFLRSLSSSQAQRLFDVPRTALCALVRRASLAQPTDRPLPSGFVEWRGRVFPESLENEATPGGLVRGALAEKGATPDRDAGIEECIALIAEGAVGPWPPPTSWVGEWMDKGRADAEGLEGESREAAIESWRKLAAEKLAAETDDDLIARYLEELAWVRWQTHGLEAASGLIATADALVSGEEVRNRIAGARVDSLFAPFLGELRLDEPGVGDAVSEAD